MSLAKPDAGEATCLQKFLLEEMTAQISNTTSLCYEFINNYQSWRLGCEVSKRPQYATLFCTSITRS